MFLKGERKDVKGRGREVGRWRDRDEGEGGETNGELHRRRGIWWRKGATGELSCRRTSSSSDWATLAQSLIYLSLSLSLSLFWDGNYLFTLDWKEEIPNLPLDLKEISHLPSLKKFHPQNLEYSISTNQTNDHALEYLGNHITWNPNFTIQLERSIQPSSNPWLSLTFHNKYKPFCYISYDQRSIMTCLSNLTHYRGNPHGYHTRPYTKSYLSPCGNCHHKETSSTTGDQTQLSPKTKERHRLSMSTRIWIVISSYLSIWEYCTKI